MKNNCRYKKGICRLLLGVFLHFCVISITLPAQETLSINLESVLELGGANNLTIKEYKLRQELAAVNVTEAREWWLPQIYAGVRTHQLNGAAMNSDGRFFLDVNRDNLWSGLGLDITWDIAKGIYNTKAAKLKSLATQYESQAERNQVLLKIIETYYDFLAAQISTQAYQLLTEQSLSITEQLELQVQSGLQYESDLLLSRSNANHLKVLALQSQVEFMEYSARLINLLDLDPGIQLVSIDTVLQQLEFETTHGPDIYALAYDQRSEIKMMEFRMQSLKEEKKNVTTGLLIPALQLNLNGAYYGALNGSVRPTMPTLYPNPGQLYPTSNLDISLMWQVPISMFTSKGEIKKYDTRILMNQNRQDQYKNQVDKEVTSAREALVLIDEQIAVAKESIILAGDAMRQSLQRQELGTVRPYELLEAQKIYMQSRLDHINALSAFNKWAWRLEVATGGNL